MAGYPWAEGYSRAVHLPPTSVAQDAPEVGGHELCSGEAACHTGLLSWLYAYSPCLNQSAA